MFNNREFTVIPNVISVEKYNFLQEKRESIREKMHVEDKLVIGTVGRMAFQKNPFFAVDVISEVVKKCPYVEYWWIGDGPLEAELAQYIESLGLSNHIKLLGRRSDICDLYQAMDRFFLPSSFEGLGIVIVEAQAMGIPCVVSDVVPKEVAYTDLVKFVSLKSTTREWSECICDFEKDQKKERVMYRELLKESMYADDPKKNALSLLYKKLCDKKKDA